MAATDDAGPALLYMHAYSYRFRLANDPDFTVVNFIEDAARRGLDGINISLGYFQPPDDTAEHLDRVRAKLAETGLGIDVETGRTDPERLRRAIEIGHRLGAQLLRTSTKMDPSGPVATMKRAIADLKEIAPRVADAGLTLVLENHEDLTSSEVAEVVAAVDSPAVRALFDYGNDMMVSELPSEGLTAMLPWITTGHLKDQVVISSPDGNGTATLGVPFGCGVLPIRDMTRRMLDGGVRRVSLQSTWAYLAAIQPGRGAGAAQSDAIFSPVQLDLSDERFCVDPAKLRSANPSLLCATEARMLDQSCAWLADALCGLPITAPKAR